MSWNLKHWTEGIGQHIKLKPKEKISLNHLEKLLNSQLVSSSYNFKRQADAGYLQANLSQLSLFLDKIITQETL